MKMHNALWLLLTAIYISQAGCKKDNSNDDQLPPVTQTGAGSFGCKINGKVYIPKGSGGTGTPNPHLQYDVGLNGQPYFSLDARQFEEDGNNSIGALFIAFGDLSHTGVYTYPSDFSFSCGWVPILGNCDTPGFDTTVKKWGAGIITKFDLPNHIISGTFDFKYKTQQCDTVFVTDGRFDIKF